MKKTLVVLLILAVSALAFGADDKDEKDATKAEDRIQAAGRSSMKSSLPRTPAFPKKCWVAECVMVVPSLLKGGFILAARYGRGVASCRTPTGWSAPAFVFTPQRRKLWVSRSAARQLTWSCWS